MTYCKAITHFLMILSFVVTLVFPYPVNAEKIAAKNEKTAPEKDNGLMQRIDFGNSYIMGQTIQSGAVYLLQRKKSEIQSMLKAREDYREEILDGFKFSNGEIESNGTYQR